MCWLFTKKINMNFIQRIIHGYKVRRFFLDAENKFKTKKVPTDKELNLISILENIQLKNWWIEHSSVGSFSSISTLRLAIETKIFYENIIRYCNWSNSMYGVDLLQMD